MGDRIAYAEPADYIPEDLRKKYKLGEYAESELLRKLKALMVGHAVGDALGVPVEFCSREELEELPVIDMMGWGSYPVPEGCWSDDTSMSLATLDSLKQDKIDYDDIMKKFVAWVSRDEYTPTGEVFDMGRTCLTAIRNYLKADGKPALECGLDEDFSNGNGSLMRIHPVAFYLYHKGYEINDALEIIHKVSSITHAHERSKVACGIYTIVLWELLENPNKLSVYEGIRKANEIYASSSEYEIYKKTLIDRIGSLEIMSSDKAVARNEIRSTGYVVDTLEAAIWCVLTTKDYKECILKAVNLGEDTDTVAAVAGGLAGVLYGYDTIPQEWLKQIKKLDYIGTMCEEAEKSWIVPDKKRT